MRILLMIKTFKNNILLIFCFIGPPTIAEETLEEVNLKKGSFIVEARSDLIADGWSPLVTNEKMEDGTYRKSIGDAKKIKSAGIAEIEGCSLAGIPYCSFNYIKSEKCLQVVTIGEIDEIQNSLKIHNWKFIECSSLSQNK